MTAIVNVADLVDPETGKTYRQQNSEMTHNIPLGALVEIRKYDWKKHEMVDDPCGLRLYVAKLGRDCDQTPLYWLSYQSPEEYQRDFAFMSRVVVEVDNMRLRGEFFGPKLKGGYSEDSLKVINLQPNYEDD